MMIIQAPAAYVNMSAKIFFMNANITLTASMKIQNYAGFRAKMCKFKTKLRESVK